MTKQTLSLDEIDAAIAAYQQHAPTGFACCSAHPVADHAEALVAEVRHLRDELEVAQRLAADATAYQVHIPESGGTTLLVRRQALAHGTGWAVSTMAPGGGRAWTTEGWQDSISALSVDRLFCWPDPATAVAAARGGLAVPAGDGQQQ